MSLEGKTLFGMPIVNINPNSAGLTVPRDMVFSTMDQWNKEMNVQRRKAVREAVESTTGIVYFNHGSKCACRLVVSLWTLRKHHPTIPVRILDTGESGGLVERIAADARLQPLDVRRIELVKNRRHKNQCYLTKATLWRHFLTEGYGSQEICGQPIDGVTFIDADTIIAGDLSELLICSRDWLTLTQFSNWTVSTPIIRKRVAGWADVAGPEVAASLGMKRSADPAVNTGVFGWPLRDRNENVRWLLGEWERITRQSNGAFIADEIAMQLLLGWAPGEVNAAPAVVLDDRFNWSPIHHATPLDQARIIHAHGGKHVESGHGARGTQGHALWMPVFEECWRENVGGVREFAPAGDERLAAHMRKLR